MLPFDDVVVEHGPTVWRVCRALLGDHEAQDAWSETLMSALRAYPTLPEGSNVRGWLVTIAHRRAIDQLRSKGRAPVPSGHLPERSDGTRDQDADAPDQRLLAAVRGLPPKQRGAVVYRYLADMSYAEVAALIDSSETAARRSAADGIAALRRTFTEST